MSDTEDKRVEKILELDKRRRAAMIAADIPMLDQLLADDLIHVHAGGNTDTKQQYFGLVRDICEFVAIERPAIDIRFYGDTAVMTGVMKHTVRLRSTGEMRVMEAFGTQVWAPHGDTWQQVLYQATEIAAH